MFRPSALALALIFLATNHPLPADAPPLEVGHLRKAANAWLIRDRNLSEAKAGDKVLSTDVLSSKTEGGFVLELADGSRIAAGGATELRVAVFNPAAQQTLVEVLHGAVRANVVTVTKPGGVFAMRTPTAYIKALGTTVGAAAIDTASSNLADTISDQNIRELPLNGRNFASLIQIEPGTITGLGGNPNITDYLTRGTTVVEEFDDISSVVAAAPLIDMALPQVTVYPLPGEFTFVNPGGAPAIPAPMFRTDSSNPDERWNARLDKWLNSQQRSNPAALTNYFLAPMDVTPCRTGFSLTGKPLWTWDPNHVAPSGGVPFQYQVLGNGFSTGLSLTINITINSPCTVDIFIPSGTMFHPKGFVGHAVAGFILGGNPSVKDFQRMTQYGALIVIIPTSSPSGGVEATSGSASVPLRSFCVDLHKLAPHQKTEYRVANADEQDKFARDQRVISHAMRMIKNGEINPGTHPVDGIIQWALWVHIEKLKEKEFLEEVKTIARKNTEAQKKKWDKQTEKNVEANARELWLSVDAILRAAYKA